MMILNIFFFTVTIKKVKETKEAFIEAKRIKEIMEETKEEYYYMGRF